MNRMPHVLYSIEGRSHGSDRSSPPFAAIDAYLDSSMFLHLFILTADRKGKATVCPTKFSLVVYFFN